MWYHTILNNIQWRLRKHLMIQQCVISELWVIFGNTHTGTHTAYIVVSSKKQHCSFSGKHLSKQNLDFDLLFKKIKCLQRGAALILTYVPVSHAWCIHRVAVLLFSLKQYCYTSNSIFELRFKLLKCKFPQWCTQENVVFIILRQHLS